MNSIDKCHKALLSLSEEFRTKSPPDLKSSMQCLAAILNLPVSAPVLAKTNFHLGSFIYKHTTDINVAQTYLQRAYEQAQTPELTHIRLQVVALLVEIYLTQNQRQLAKQLLTRAINDTTTSGGGHQNLYWHYRFLLKLSHLNLQDNDFLNANNLVSIGVQTASAIDDQFTRILFLLSKGMVIMIARKYPNALMPQQQQHIQQQVSPDQQIVETMNLAKELFESLDGDDPSKREVLKIFYHVLQVCHCLNKGQNKSAKASLKLLQQSIQNLTNSSGPDPTAFEETNYISPNMIENFIWLPKDHMCVLVYLISVLHSMQAGILEKAQKYTEKALVQIERLRTPTPDILLDSFQVLLLEHMSMCHLVMGNRTSAIKDMVQVIQFCYKSTPRFRSRHTGNIRTLLGLYAMSMSMMDEAENHFKAVMNEQNVGSELRMMSMLNLTLCYLQDDTRREERRQDVEALLSRINPEQLNNSSCCLKAAAYYVYGLKAFCDSRFIEAKRNLRETLKMANGEELNRLTSCSLVLLGKIFINLESPRESLSMVSPAMKLAGKMPDIHVQLWAASVLREIYSRETNSQPYVEASNMHENFRYILHQDRLLASSSQEHNYVRWADWH